MKKIYLLTLVGLLALGTLTAMAVDYAESFVKYGENCARIKSGATAPTNTVTGFTNTLKTIPPHYLIIDGGALREKTTQEKMDFWMAYKDNHTGFIALENRFMSRLGTLNSNLLAEGVITNAYVPATMTTNSLAASVNASTNAAVTNIHKFLIRDLDHLERVAPKILGPVPDGSTVLENIEQH